jgi:hypothetical protein
VAINNTLFRDIGILKDAKDGEEEWEMLERAVEWISQNKAYEKFLHFLNFQAEMAVTLLPESERKSVLGIRVTRLIVYNYCRFLLPTDVTVVSNPTNSALENSVLKRFINWNQRGVEVLARTRKAKEYLQMLVGLNALLIHPTTSLQVMALQVDYYRQLLHLLTCRNALQRMHPQWMQVFTLKLNFLLLQELHFGKEMKIREKELKIREKEFELPVKSISPFHLINAKGNFGGCLDAWEEFHLVHAQFNFIRTFLFKTGDSAADSVPIFKQYKGAMKEYLKLWSFEILLAHQ